MDKVQITKVNYDFEERFLDFTNKNKAYHSPWVSTPKTKKEFDNYLKKYSAIENKSFLVLDSENDAIVGVVNINNIIRGCFQNAFLGYYGNKLYAKSGLMTLGLKKIIAIAFNELSLHRLEANVQPNNHSSIALLNKCGFKHEGFSPRYLKINDKWEDHERFAITFEDYSSKINTNKAT